MLHRFSKQGMICITQPNHAWLSGQLAQIWGNEQFGDFVPRKEVCFGAEQHDIGWVVWEQSPTLNPQTGYPHHFTELPTQEHIKIWSNAKQFAFVLGRYVALLISLHGTGLYERFTSWQNSPTSTQIVEKFLKQEYLWQDQLINLLKNDPYYSAYVTPEVITRNRKLVATWDALSIIVCQGMNLQQQLVHHVPMLNGEATLELTLLDNHENHQQIAVFPWPFQLNEVTLVYEGKFLRHTFSNEMTMQEALMGDCWVTLTTTLKPN
ncbi:DUF3891 family protein [Fischerella thermalis]|jgi:hypothetical protein|uniref:DUF3891 family protein n=1 Tax=Fischerella thermalis JSC-11 TaxID=741277 RepID=G6G0C0_9CYAN|nr:DUF3891 family protein [Fischerella thermalis]PLZ76632.1 hypothetical protein CBP16_22215 [Fischerella thermalis WC217]PLZ95608.1 DUF3891 domain-containing protein [Fischerella thermalis CCMEE 5328]EHC08370.1 hypothetical protein FJSC11DRAFT_4569 [Fischerella thermalis JSC-11]PLZ08173.1 hypothetical protein CBP19_17740 [Fischerella thermalis WC1110]PLZ08683.1 hypothetical protein CBP18_13185 [Fischerella thermalis WC119]